MHTKKSVCNKRLSQLNSKPTDKGRDWSGVLASIPEAIDEQPDKLVRCDTGIKVLS